MAENSFEDDGDIRFPVITISIFNEDLREPIHVDLGSVPPFVAVAVLEKVINELKMAAPAAKITFKGIVLSESFGHSVETIDALYEAFLDEEDDEGEIQ